MSTATRDKRPPQRAPLGDPRFESVRVTDTYITAHLSDGRVVSVPLWWSWRLEKASKAEREHCQIIGAGYTAHWPDVDEHLSVEGFLTGTPAPRPEARQP